MQVVEWHYLLFIHFQSFERIICENRIQDLQPSLASAVKSINRWHLIQSSVPYILQCCSLLLSNRGCLGTVDRLGNAERELLYTLHWILLEGPRVCCVVDTDSLLYPLTTIEQFVHELTPHVYRMRESDLTFRLENGVAIWGPLWKHEKPSITLFTSEVITKDTDPDVDSPSALESDPEFSAATFFDVAVLKCLSSTGWDENGVVWALRYLAAYLKKEFNLPDQEKGGEPSEGIQVNIPVHGSSVGSGNPDTKLKDNSIEGDTPAREMAKSDGEELDKVTGSDTSQNLGSGVSNDPEKLSVCACQVECDTKVDTGKAENQESVVSKGFENLQLAVPQSSAIHEEEPSLPSPSNDQGNACISGDLDGERLTAPGLERTGSIKFRIRVQSSPGFSAGGRVLTAVASPTGSASQHEPKNTTDDNSQDITDSGTFQSPKVYIKPSNTICLPSVSTDDANSCLQDRESPLHLEAQADENHCNEVSTIGFPSETPMEVHPVKSLDTAIVSPESALTALHRNEQTFPGPSQMDIIRSQELTISSEVFESKVSYECEVQDSRTVAFQTESGATNDQVKDESLYKRLSEHASSSHASSSSVESESQPLLKPSPLATADVKPLTIQGSLDTPRGSINRDSFTRTDRYFVFPGAADYITADGRLSSLVILQALNSIMRENPSSLVCDVAIVVLQQLVTVNEIKKSKKRGSSVEVDDRTVAETQAVGFRSPHSDNILGRLRASFYGKPPSFLSLAMGCLFSLIKALGCPLGNIVHLKKCN